MVSCILFFSFLHWHPPGIVDCSSNQRPPYIPGHDIVCPPNNSPYMTGCFSFKTHLIYQNPVKGQQSFLDATNAISVLMRRFEVVETTYEIEHANSRGALQGACCAGGRGSYYLRIYFVDGGNGRNRKVNSRSLCRRAFQRSGTHCDQPFLL